jgi:hypothetical protein
MATLNLIGKETVAGERIVIENFSFIIVKDSLRF